MSPSVPPHQLMCTRGRCSLLPRKTRLSCRCSQHVARGRGAWASQARSVMAPWPLCIPLPLKPSSPQAPVTATPHPSSGYFSALCLFGLAQAEESVPHISTAPCTEQTPAASTEPWRGKLGHLLGLPPRHPATPFAPPPDRCADGTPWLTWLCLCKATWPSLAASPQLRSCSELANRASVAVVRAVKPICTRRTGS